MQKKLLILGVLLGAVAFFVYKNCSCCNPPKLPEVNLELWWGPTELKGKQDASIRPFKVEFSELMVKDLRQRLSFRRKFTPPLEGVGFHYGFNTDYLEEVLDYWKDMYNFQEREEFLNKFKQYKTNIQGLDMHFIHVKPTVSKDTKVVPLLLLHGWPGSVREFYDIIPLLTTKREGYNFAFEVIVPSLPGYGFSSAAVRPGLGAFEVAIVMRNLMQRIGHKQYYVQGGDWGALICKHLAIAFPNEVLGYHSNMLSDMSTKARFKELIGAIYPPLIVEEKYAARIYPLSEKYGFLMEELGFLHLQASKPDSIGVALSDSPAGLAAYILEKFSTWTDREFRDHPDGKLTKKYKLVDLLDNVMLYWTTNSMTTAMRLYAESFNKRHLGLKLDEIPTSVPTWALKTMHESIFQPDNILRVNFPNLINSTVLDYGGHFAAFELPAVVSEDIFKAVAAFRQFHEKKEKTEL